MFPLPPAKPSADVRVGAEGPVGKAGGENHRMGKWIPNLGFEIQNSKFKMQDWDFGFGI
jgi:hypothetical protein